MALVRRVLVLGGGVAGLATAIGLARQGAQVTLAERAAQWPTTGWGLSLPGRALRALRELDLAAPCVWAGYGVSEVVHCDATGEIGKVVELPRVLGPDQPAQIGMAHGTLHQILRGEADNSGVQVRMGLAVTRIAQTEDGVGVRLGDGGTVHADLVVGADGVHSAVRTLVGIEGALRPAGLVSWRATVARPSWLTAPYLFAGASLVPISPRQAYLSLVEPGAVSDEFGASQFRALLNAFPSRLAADLGDPQDVVRQPVHAGAVGGARHRGRVVLVGDAAHPPVWGENTGVALAVEDAVALAEELTGHDDVEHALKAFTERRIEPHRPA
jgi:2-polyprenyl-6-methoxyphenol hydroxylase-like FAD-dependent oxidoreductase